jgi:hypothetical protein
MLDLELTRMVDRDVVNECKGNMYLGEAWMEFGTLIVTLFLISNLFDSRVIRYWVFIPKFRKQTN